MSAIPKRRTQILVKDLLFQEKYNLSHTQTDLMAYLVNLVYWAIKVDEYFVLATSKIMNDLPKMGQKTFEHSLKVLKDKGLIECKIVEVKQWQGKPKLRGVRLTKKGEEYNSNLVLPTQDKEKRELEKENKELKEIIKQLKIEAKNQKDTKEKKEENIKESEPPKKDKLNDFREKIVKKFGDIGKPICNLVPHYQVRTTFYINSYRKLAITTPQGDYKQLENPKDIYNFWQWLYQNQNRIDDVIDFTKSPTVEDLKERYIGKTITLGDTSSEIIDFIPIEDKVKIKLKLEDNKKGFLINSTTKKEATFCLDECQSVILKLLG